MEKSTTNAGSHPVIFIEKNIMLPVCQNFKQKLTSTYWRIFCQTSKIRNYSANALCRLFWVKNIIPRLQNRIVISRNNLNEQSLNSAIELRPTWLKLQMLAAFIVSFVNTMAVTNRIRTDSKIAAATAGLVSPNVSKESIKSDDFPSHNAKTRIIISTKNGLKNLLAESCTERDFQETSYNNHHYHP